jgi:hypothetical protein
LGYTQMEVFYMIRSMESAGKKSRWEYRHICSRDWLPRSGFVLRASIANSQYLWIPDANQK